MAEPINHPQASMLLFHHETASGHVLAEARLNSEATLNSLSLDMIDILAAALEEWRGDATVVAVLLSGAGDRAFSAGGDIQALYRAMVRNHEHGERIDEYPFEFFEREYRLDFALHTFPKPVIALGHGVMMGGGLGVFMGADFRIVPEKTRIAMPEVTVGLFPDAGGTWMLRNMPEHQALFMGMTGASINSADALAAGLASHGVAAADTVRFREQLLAARWHSQADADRALIEQLLDQFTLQGLPDPQLDTVPETLHGAGLMDTVRQLRELQGINDWIDKALAAMERGCPTTIGIVIEQLARARNLTLAQCFQLEMTVATHCAENHDFAEGVRALLIDKDNAPAWQFGDVESLPEAYVLSHFEEPWANNPLADLEDIER